MLFFFIWSRVGALRSCCERSSVEISAKHRKANTFFAGFAYCIWLTDRFYIVTLLFLMRKRYMPP